MPHGLLMNVPLWIGLPVLVVTAIAARVDLRTRRIPNRLTGPALLLGVIVHFATHGLSGLSSSLLGMAVAGGLLLPGWIAGFMGAGDVKLMAAVGAWLCFPLAVFAALAALIAGGVISLIVAVRKGVLMSSLRGAVSLAGWLVQKRGGVAVPAPPTSGVRFPFGIAVMAGSVAALWMRV